MIFPLDLSAASLAQRLEHWSCKPGVESSNLSRGLFFSTFFFFFSYNNPLTFYFPFNPSHFYFLSGKILNDSSPLNEYNIQESNFVVVMVSKSKPAKTSAPSSEVCNYVLVMYVYMSTGWQVNTYFLFRELRHHNLSNRLQRLVPPLQPHKRGMYVCVLVYMIVVNTISSCLLASSASRESQVEPTEQPSATSAAPTAPTVSLSQSSTTSPADSTAGAISTDGGDGQSGSNWISSASALGWFHLGEVLGEGCPSLKPFVSLRSPNLFAPSLTLKPSTYSPLGQCCKLRPYILCGLSSHI